MGLSIFLLLSPLSISPLSPLPLSLSLLHFYLLLITLLGNSRERGKAMKLQPLKCYFHAPWENKLHELSQWTDTRDVIQVQMQRLACIDFTSEISTHIMQCTHIKYIQREINACKGTMLATYTGVHNTTCKYTEVPHCHPHTHTYTDTEEFAIKYYTQLVCTQVHSEAHTPRSTEK